MKDFLEKKVTVLEFKKQYFNEEDENRGYPSGNAEDLEKKLSNKELFEEKNINLLHQLEEQINALEFSRKYWQQRDKDLDKNTISGYSDYYLNRVLFGKDKNFEEYCDLLIDKGRSVLKEYEKGAQSLDIKGEMFFMGIWDYIDYPVKDYFPSDNEGFDPKFDVDERTLIEIIQAVFDVLERNKERWEYKQSEDIKI